MVTPVSISNYISLPDDFPVRNIAPQVKEVLKDFIDALSTIICDEEWRTSLNINSATKKIFNNLDNLSYIQRTSFRGNDTLYNENFGKLGNQYASALVSTAIALLLVCLALLLPAANSEIHLGVLSIFWGIAMMIIGLGMQVKVLALAPDATDVAMALFSGIFNIGIGAGALVGNQVSLHWSMSMIGYVGAVPAFAALIWSIIIFRRWPVTLEEQTQ